MESAPNRPSIFCTCWCGSFRNPSIRPNSSITCNVEGCTVSPRKSRKKSACFSSTSVSTPARPNRYPSIMPAGPPPTMQHLVWMMRRVARSAEVPASMILFAYLAPKTLDLRHAAVAVGQLHRDELGRGRELQIGQRVMGNDAGIPHIARWHFQHPVRHRAVDADADFTDRATIRHQMGVIDQQ